MAGNLWISSEKYKGVSSKLRIFSPYQTKYLLLPIARPLNPKFNTFLKGK